MLKTVSYMVLKRDIAHILAVDDDDRIRRLLAQYLSKNGYIIVTAEDTQKARAILKSYEFDLCILDIMMPGETGLELGKFIKSAHDIPILFLTAMGESRDRIAGLEIGADDYLPKPFEPKELLLRVQAILNRTRSTGRTEQISDGNILKSDILTYDFQKELLTISDQEIFLTDNEKALFKIFAQKPNIPLRREMLSAQLGLEINDRAIDVQITRLRKKIENDPSKPKYIQTVRGKGYMLKLL